MRKKVCSKKAGFRGLAIAAALGLMMTLAGPTTSNAQAWTLAEIADFAVSGGAALIGGIDPGIDVDPIQALIAGIDPGIDLDPIQALIAGIDLGIDVDPLQALIAGVDPGIDLDPLQALIAGIDPGVDIDPLQALIAGVDPGIDIDPLQALILGIDLGVDLDIIQALIPVAVGGVTLAEPILQRVMKMPKVGPFLIKTMMSLASNPKIGPILGKTLKLLHRLNINELVGHLKSGDM